MHEGEEMGRNILSKIACYDELVEAVNAEDRDDAIKALIKYAMADIRFLQIQRPALEMMQLSSIMDSEEAVEFRKKLKKVCMPDRAP